MQCNIPAEPMFWFDAKVSTLFESNTGDDGDISGDDFNAFVGGEFQWVSLLESKTERNWITE